MKPLVSGDLLKQEGCQYTHIQHRVDTITHDGVTVYKYQVVTEVIGRRIYHLAWQMFIGDDKVCEDLNCYKFLTKSDFKTLCSTCLIDHFKESLNIK